jgi:acetyl esterase/lipase
MGSVSPRSLTYRIAEAAVAGLGPRKIFSLGPRELRAFLERSKEKQHGGPPAYIGKRYNLARETVEGWPVYRILPKGNAAAEGRAVLFIHGGGYILGAHRIHWRAASRLAAECGAAVWFADYPLLPDHTIAEAVSFLDSVYAKMLEQYPAGGITVLGDSAGASLALSLCHHAGRRENPPPMPGKLILVSPVGMLEPDEAIDSAMRRAAPKDVMVSMELSRAAVEFGLTADRENYVICPLYGDFSRFPPMHIFSGTFECGFPQIEAFVARLKAAGIQVEFHAGKEMMHIWPYIPFVPECEKTLQLIFGIVGR